MKHLLVEKLEKIMQAKKTNLCVSADFTKCEDILNLAENTGDSICLIKTHIDILEDFSLDFVKKLKEISERKNFLIFEDRKFADIGNTVSLQFSKGIYHIADWADFINAHTIVGPGIVEGLKKVNKNSGLILLAQMTPKGNLFTQEYGEKSVEIAKTHADFVMGFIGSSDKPELLQNIREKAGNNFLIMTPGIKLQSGGDNLGQTYNTPEKSAKNGGDIIIVGRGIYQSENPKTEAEKYQKAGWEAYLKYRR